MWYFYSKKILYLRSNSDEGIIKNTFHLHLAQVAELVDALVSNTSSFGSAGSTPALGTTLTLIFGSGFFYAFLFLNQLAL